MAGEVSWPRGWVTTTKGPSESLLPDSAPPAFLALGGLSLDTTSFPTPDPIYSRNLLVKELLASLCTRPLGLLVKVQVTSRAHTTCSNLLTSANANDSRGGFPSEGRDFDAHHCDRALSVQGSPPGACGETRDVL